MNLEIKVSPNNEKLKTEEKQKEQIIADGFEALRSFFGKEIFERYLEAIILERNLKITVDDLLSEFSDILCSLSEDQIKKEFVLFKNSIIKCLMGDVKASLEFQKNYHEMNDDLLEKFLGKKLDDNYFFDIVHDSNYDYYKINKYFYEIEIEMNKYVSELNRVLNY